MKLRVVLLFGGILAGMLFVTIRASLARSVFDNAFLITDVWGIATLADAYAGFLTFYAWVFYREKTVVTRVLWFVAIMALGNIAMSSYVLIAIARLPKDATASQLLLRQS